MNPPSSPKLEYRQISHLKPHPANQDIYRDDPDPIIVDSIRRKGVLEPLLITSDDLIIAGHRRWRGAKLAEQNEVPVVPYASSDEWDILEALIESNRQREKTIEQRA